MTRWTVGLLAVLAVLLAACGTGAPQPGAFPQNADGYADVSVAQLAALLEKEDVTLVNVHVPYEGEIPETDLFLPYDQIAGHLDQLPDKEAPIVLYCRSGGMSTSAAQELAGLGYGNVLELDGGFQAWEAAGYELLDEER